MCLPGRDRQVEGLQEGLMSQLHARIGGRGVLYGTARNVDRAGAKHQDAGQGRQGAQTQPPLLPDAETDGAEDQVGDRCRRCRRCRRGSDGPGQSREDRGPDDGGCDRSDQAQLHPDLEGGVVGMKLDARPEGAARIQPPSGQGTGPDPVHRLPPIAQALKPGLRKERGDALVKSQGEGPLRQNRRQQKPPRAQSRQETWTQGGKAQDQARRQDGAGEGQEGRVVAEDEGRSDDPGAQNKVINLEGVLFLG